MPPAPYACWMYHRDLPARIFYDAAEVDALGPDWADTPAAFAVATGTTNGQAVSGDKLTQDAAPVVGDAILSPELQAKAEAAAKRKR